MSELGAGGLEKGGGDIAAQNSQNFQRFDLLFQGYGNFLGCGLGQSASLRGVALRIRQN